MNPCIKALMIFDKGAQNYHGVKKTSSTNVAGITGYLHAKTWSKFFVFHSELI
jgi:hypothetical protein